MTQATFIASDIHLGAVPERTEHRFLRFLDHVGDHADRLILAGDLFDFWFEYGRVIVGEHFRVLARLAELVEAGVPVLMVGGNHDAWGGRFLREEVGIYFHMTAVRTEIAGRAALIAHGDGVGRGDFRYRALKTVLRSRAAILAFRALHPELGLKLARAISSTEGKAEGESGAGGRAAHISAWAKSCLRADSELGWVVCGHAHLPAIEEVEPARYYLNAGDWIRHHTYITVGSDGRPVLCRWRGSDGGS